MSFTQSKRANNDFYGLLIYARIKCPSYTKVNIFIYKKEIIYLKLTRIILYKVSLVYMYYRMSCALLLTLSVVNLIIFAFFKTSQTWFLKSINKTQLKEGQNEKAPTIPDNRLVHLPRH